MFDPGLSQADVNEVMLLLRRSHTISARVQILDLEHNFMSNISEQVLDGQITVDWNGDDATRVFSLAVFDPDYDLGFDTSQFIDGVWFLDRMVQVVAEVYVPRLFRTIEFPLFTGPVKGFKRTKAIVSMDCVGKDIFAKQSWPRYNILKGTNYVTALKNVLMELGETKFRFSATTTSTLAADKVIDRDGLLSPWGWCRQVAASLGMRLHYDGEGYACLRNRNNTNPVYTFTDGDEGTILTQPETTGDYSRIANVVRAEGPMTGDASNPFWEETVDISSPIHPSKLTRGGKPLYLGVVVQRDSIVTQADAKTVAKDELRDRQQAAYDVSFDSLPLWMMEEGDLIGTQVEGFTNVSTLLQFSFGLKPDAVMPIGYTDLVAPTLAKIRRF